MFYWNQYDVYLATIGGLYIGIATSAHLWIKGRITGFSGIFYSLITFETKSFFWKLALILSVVAISAIMFQIYG